MSVPYPITPEEIQHAEAVLLGSLLLYPEQGTLIHTVLQPEDFSEVRRFGENTTIGNSHESSNSL